jgi:hypothetical protein
MTYIWESYLFSCLQVRQESRAELLKKYKKVTTEEAEESWTGQYDASEKVN